MRKLIFLFAINFFYSAQSDAQDTLKNVLAKSEIEPPYYCTDENGKEYQRKAIGPSYYVDFTKVDPVGKCDSFLIEGYVLLSNTKDYGMIGITFFLGKLKGATIYSIRNLGKCNNSTENSQHKDGFFSFICKILPDDKLFFCDVLRGGLTVFEIGKLVSETKDHSSNCQVSQKKEKPN